MLPPWSWMSLPESVTFCSVSVCLTSSASAAAPSLLMRLSAKPRLSRSVCIIQNQIGQQKYWQDKMVHMLHFFIRKIMILSGSARATQHWVQHVSKLLKLQKTTSGPGDPLPNPPCALSLVLVLSPSARYPAPRHVILFPPSPKDCRGTQYVLSSLVFPFPCSSSSSSIGLFNSSLLPCRVTWEGVTPRSSMGRSFPSRICSVRLEVSTVGRKSRLWVSKY